MNALLRHIEAVGNVTLPGDYIPFHLGAEQIGWVRPQARPRLLALGCRKADGGLMLAEPGQLGEIAARLAREGAFPDRGEAFDVRANPGGPVLATLDRGALAYFGIAAEGVHVNGLVERADGLHIWIGRRNANRPMDPGRLDHLVAGGIPAGLTPAATLVKEGAEEAGLPETVMRAAQPACIIAYTMARPEGLRRDRLHCYDLVLPGATQPCPTDDEVVGFELWPAARVARHLRDTDDFKFNVAVVLIDLLLRRGCLPVGEAAHLQAAMQTLRRNEAA